MAAAVEHFGDFSTGDGARRPIEPDATEGLASRLENKVSCLCLTHSLVLMFR